MSEYSASTLERLASELEAADKEMAPAPWTPNVWIETDGNEWRATGPGHDGESPYDYSQPGGPDEQAAQRDARGLCNLRNSAPEVAAALRAAVAKVTELEVSRSRHVQHMDAGWQAEADSLRTRLADLEALVEEACDIALGRAPAESPELRVARVEAIRAAAKEQSK